MKYWLIPNSGTRKRDASALQGEALALVRERMSGFPFKARGRTWELSNSSSAMHGKFGTSQRGGARSAPIRPPRTYMPLQVSAKKGYDHGTHFWNLPFH